MLQVEKTTFISLLIFMICLLGPGNSFDQEQKQEQKPKDKIEKPKIYREDYPIISESDLYCSFFLLGEEKVEAKIVSAEKKEEMKLLTDSDVFYIDRGKDAGFKVNQVYLILEVGPEIQDPATDKKLGHLGFKRGRARIFEVGEDWGKARVEKSCGRIMVGDFLIPFEEREALLKRPPREEMPEGGPAVGTVVYLEGDYKIISKDQLALIDLGRMDGLRVGDRLTAHREVSAQLAPKLLGELIIINAQSQTSTVKVLSSRDSIKLGDLVRVKTKEESQ